jgi:broad-specificity NMP kinase
MEMVFITGAPGIGKSTALNLLLRHWQPGDAKTALMDGDQLARMVPRTEAERASLVAENLCACGKQFENNGVQLFVAACCLASKECVDLLVGKLKQCGWRTHVIALVASDEDLIHRNEDRGASQAEEGDFFDLVRNANAAIRNLDDVFVLDTSGMTREEVADGLASVIGRLTRPR